MIKQFLFAGGAALALTASPAFAQEAPASETEIYVGGQVGYHSIDEIDFNEIGVDASTDIDGLTYGGFAGVILPSRSDLLLGAEANYMVGTDAIDREYGVAGLVGTRFGSNSRVFLKAGYQWVDFDVADIAGQSADDLGLSGPARDAFIDDVAFVVDGDDVGSGFLIGAGVDVGVGPGFLRLGADTVEFDTVRATAGFGINF
ncbi:hypothetical protein WJT74_06790 [Sphingomicrobium sp. XHP0239]|uniref:hypothetical protein n=1 Tax=Sphingomicrobium maritimum TaxID=3133972 RepID=UPI0031CCA7B4